MIFGLSSFVNVSCCGQSLRAWYRSVSATNIVFCKLAFTVDKGIEISYKVQAL